MVRPGSPDLPERCPSWLVVRQDLRPLIPTVGIKIINEAVQQIRIHTICAIYCQGAPSVQWALCQLIAKHFLVLSFQFVPGFPPWEFLFPGHCRCLVQSSFRLNELISINNSSIWTGQKWFIWSRFLVYQSLKFPRWEFEHSLAKKTFIMVKQCCCWIVYLANCVYDRSANMFGIAYCNDIDPQCKEIPTVGISLQAIQQWIVLLKCWFSCWCFVVAI